MVLTFPSRSLSEKLGEHVKRQDKPFATGDVAISPAFRSQACPCEWVRGSIVAVFCTSHSRFVPYILGAASVNQPNANFTVGGYGI